MSDIAKRLRTLSDEFDCDNTYSMALFRDEVLKAATEIERLTAAMRGYQDRLATESANTVRAIDRLTEAAAFLDQLADSLDGTLIDEPIDCRAMAKKLRGVRHERRQGRLVVAR